jgi:hypothetical protein
MAQLIGTEFADFNALDIVGNQVSRSGVFQRPVGFIGFANRKTGNTMNEIILNVYGHYIDRASFVQFMDVTTVPELLRKLPKIALKHEYKALSQKLSENARKNNKDVDLDAVKNRFFMVPDWQGEFVYKYIPKDKMNTIHLLLIDKNHMIKHYIDEYTPGSHDSLRAKIEEILKEEG